MTAGVGLKPFIVALGAAQDMRAQSGRVAPADRIGSALLTAMQRSSGCIRREVLDKDVLRRNRRTNTSARQARLRFPLSKHGLDPLGLMNPGRLL